MNKYEKRMLEILKHGAEQFGYVGVKAEFEAEGTRIDELLRLTEITRRAGLNLGIKIGGCEAVRDLFDAKKFGAEYVIAPMVESSYALSKFIQIKNKFYDSDEQKDVSFLFNVESKTAFAQISDLIKTATVSNGVNGIVFGRVDYTGSLNQDRNLINSDSITNDCIKVAQLCATNKLEYVVGGGVALNAISSLKAIYKVHLDRFETRKIIFSAKILNTNSIEAALESAVEFELNWLKNKALYYDNIASEDSERINMLELRLAK